MSRPRGSKSSALDAARTGISAPIATQSNAVASGGSVFADPIAVQAEGHYLSPPKLKLEMNPFGRNWLASKSRSMSVNDIEVRGIIERFNWKGYFDYSTVTTTVEGLTSGYELLVDYYGMLRDLGKRSLKYKHTPDTLTNADMFLDYFNVAYWTIRTLTTLFDLNRMGMYSPAFTYLTQYLPQYISRINKAWFNLSAIPLPKFVKDRAIKDGHILYIPGLICPTIKWCSLEDFPASGGPTNSLGSNDYTAFEVLTTAPAGGLAVMTTQIEACIRWLNAGPTGGSADFTALKDAVDMTSDVIPGIWAPGLPKKEEMPGLVSDMDAYIDLCGRAVFAKDITGTTDQWTIFPVVGETIYGVGRIPMLKFGAWTEEQCTLLGRPKYGYFNSSIATRSANVNSACRIAGTTIGGLNSFQNASAFVQDLFGVNNEESMIRNGAPTTEIQYDTAATDGIVDGVIDWNSADAIRNWMYSDTIRSKHHWASVHVMSRESWPATDWTRFIDEAKMEVRYPDVADFGQNYSTWLAKALGVPFYRS